MSRQELAEKPQRTGDHATSKLDHYLKAGTADNTRTAYQADIRSFQDWGGLLPASAKMIGLYLVEHAESLSINTLTRRLAGLSAWHKAQGFSDPTQSLMVKKTMRGIRREHNFPARKARPINLDEVQVLVRYLDQEIEQRSRDGLVTARDETNWLMANRDKAMLLTGFWRGLRADSLCKLRREFVQSTEVMVSHQRVPSLSLFMPHSKGDREAQGETLTLPPMPGKALCPVTALSRWLEAASLGNKSVLFPGFDRKGILTDKPLAASSLNHWLKRLCKKAGISQPERFSSHSLRRGLANHMVQQGADTQVLMEYIGWKSPTTAMGYVQRGQDGFDLLMAND